MPTSEVMATFDKNKIKVVIWSMTTTRTTLAPINLNASLAAVQKLLLLMAVIINA